MLLVEASLGVQPPDFAHLLFIQSCGMDLAALLVSLFGHLVFVVRHCRSRGKVVRVCASAIVAEMHDQFGHLWTVNVDSQCDCHRPAMRVAAPAVSHSLTIAIFGCAAFGRFTRRGGTLTWLPRLRSPSPEQSLHRPLLVARGRRGIPVPLSSLAKLTHLEHPASPPESPPWPSSGRPLPVRSLSARVGGRWRRVRGGGLRCSRSRCWAGRRPCRGSG